MLAAADARRTAASGKNTVCSVKNRVQYTIYGLSTEYGDNPVEDRLSSLFTETQCKRYTSSIQLGASYRKGPATLVTSSRPQPQ